MRSCAKRWSIKPQHPEVLEASSAAPPTACSRCLMLIMEKRSAGFVKVDDVTLRTPRGGDTMIRRALCWSPYPYPFGPHREYRVSMNPIRFVGFAEAFRQIGHFTFPTSARKMIFLSNVRFPPQPVRRAPHSTFRSPSSAGRRLVGALIARRQPEVRPFTPAQIKLLEDLFRPGGHRDRERAAALRNCRYAIATLPKRWSSKRRRARCSM